MVCSNAHSIPGRVQTPMEHLTALQKAEKMLRLETAPLWVWIHLGLELHWGSELGTWVIELMEPGWADHTCFQGPGYHIPSSH